MLLTVRNRTVEINEELAKTIEDAIRDYIDVSGV